MRLPIQQRGELQRDCPEFLRTDAQLQAERAARAASIAAIKCALAGGDRAAAARAIAEFARVLSGRPPGLIQHLEIRAGLR